MLNLIILLLTAFELNKDYYYINKLSVKHRLEFLPGDCIGHVYNKIYKTIHNNMLR